MHTQCHTHVHMVSHPRACGVTPTCTVSHPRAQCHTHVHSVTPTCTVSHPHAQCHTHVHSVTPTCTVSHPHAQCHTHVHTMSHPLYTAMLTHILYAQTTHTCIHIIITIATPNNNNLVYHWMLDHGNQEWRINLFDDMPTLPTHPVF